MFAKKTYVDRRRGLRDRIQSGLILFLGHNDAPMNYTKNTYFFRQNSSFLYFFGIDEPGLAAVIDIDENKEILFGDDITIDDIVWTGPLPTMRSKADKTGIKEVMPTENLRNILETALKKGQKIHFLPPYRADTRMKLEELLGIRAATVSNFASADLIRAVVELRSFKSEEEIIQIESALAVTADMYREAAKLAQPGRKETEIAGGIEGIALRCGRHLAFPPIVTIHGETLHNLPTDAKLKKGDLLLIDSGSESELHYASDITRTFPVGGAFADRQKEIYQIVLQAQLNAIDAIRPGAAYKDIHLLACKTIVEGLKGVGLMKGDAEEAVQNGAHAMFFPHGLGHMMGLDVHDMEDLGENYVGYDKHFQRSDQFGLAYLRLAKKLKSGFVMTVEPGIYFIPALIDQWQAEKKHEQFIRYNKVDTYRDFSGIRIEDNVLVTGNGRRVLGEGIAKSVKETETIMER